MARPRADRPVAAEHSAPAQTPAVQKEASGAPWFFEATLKQEIQRRKQRRWRAAAFVRLVTRVVLPGSMIVVVVLCGILVLL